MRGKGRRKFRAEKTKRAIDAAIYKTTYGAEGSPSSPCRRIDPETGAVFGEIAPPAVRPVMRRRVYINGEDPKKVLERQANRIIQRSYPK